MKKRLPITLALLAAAALACNLPLISGTRPTPEKPNATSLVAATSTRSKPATAVPAVTTTQPAPVKASPTAAPPSQALTATPPLAATGDPVVLSRLKTDPMQLSVVDPLTGRVQRSFNAVGLMENAPAYVAADAVFYLDSGYKVIRRAGFDGSASELTFINPTNELFKGAILPSPDGKMIAWAVIAEEAGDSTHNLLKIANLDGSAEQTLVDETVSPPASWSPVGWSPDGQWLYFASTPYGIGGYIMFSGVSNVRRIPVKGGTAEDVLLKQVVMGDAALSPDGKTVAFIHSVYGQDPSNVKLNLELQAVDSQKIKSFVLPAGYLQAGAIVWSQDSQSLVLCLAVGNFDSEAFTLLQVDAGTLAVKILLTKDNRLLRPVTWPVAGMLWLKDSSDLAWRMDVATGKLTQAGADLTVLSNHWR